MIVNYCRLNEQEKLEKAKQALEDMIVADEELQQDQVEKSLKRTEKMLQVSILCLIHTNVEIHACMRASIWCCTQFSCVRGQKSTRTSVCTKVPKVACHICWINNIKEI